MKHLPLHRRPWFAKRVLEIGGGHDPYSGVTHAVDMLPEDNSQRAGAMKVAKNVVFREGILEDIPFKDGEKFDFLYLSHVMEHTPSPQKAAAEINRVAQKGYIETPSPLREQITCPRPFDAEKDFHLHFIWVSQRAPNTIAFVRKNEKTLGEFTSSKAGQLSRTLCELAHQKNLPESSEIESLLPRSSKMTALYFNAPLQVIEYPTFADAFAHGDDAYRSAEDVLSSLRFPIVLRSARFRKLRKLLNQKF